MRRTMFALVLSFGIVIPAGAQTSADLTARYRQVTAYEVRPGILMVPRYGADGQVCAITLERRHDAGKAVNLDIFLSDELVQELVNELVPEAERTKGPEADSLDGSTVALAQTTITWRLYKNISVEELGLVGEPRGKLVAIIKWEDRDCTGPVY